MTSLRWLHLTDLHVGMQGMSSLWPAVDAAFQRDLEALHGQIGGFDVVLFSGDLVYSGKDAEYDALTKVLGKLWDWLRRLGSTPALLCVPGNHDMVRPSQISPAARALLNWSRDPDLRARVFWDDIEGQEYRDVINSAFAGFTRWRRAWDEAHPLPPWITRNNDGLLPGDFRATIKRNGLSVCVLGLNSAFLHLNNRIARGQLALHPNQLNKLCGGDPNNLATDHHLAFLMTHHPPDWLGPDALALYQSAIFLPHWFAAHFCGHMHEPQTIIQSTSGGPPNRLFQGASLFGLETWQTAQGNDEKRIHGYTAGRLEMDGKGKTTIRFWPRCMQQTPRSINIIPDYFHFSLDPNQGNSFDIDLGIRTSTSGPAVPDELVSHRPSFPSIPAKGSTARAPQPPGLGYDPDWYVPRQTQERMALAVLSQPGAPVLFIAPPMSGKSTVLRRIIAEIHKESHRTERSCTDLFLDLGELSDAALDDTEMCLREMGVLIVEAYIKALSKAGNVPADVNDWIDISSRRPGAPERRLSHLMEMRILAGGADRLILAMDRFDRIMNRRAGNPVARMLRQWVQNKEHPLWSKLRLMLAASGANLYFASVDDVSELLNVTLPIRLEGFRMAELRYLADLYRRPWLEDELDRLLDLVDGQPYLTRLILFLEAMGTPQAELLDLDQLRTEHCASQLRQIWLLIKDREHLRKPLCALLKDPSLKLSADDYANLHQAGLVQRDRDNDRYVVPNALLLSYVREMC